MNGINYTTVLNHSTQLSQTGAISRLSPLLKAIAVITLAFIAIGAVYLAISQGMFRRMKRSSGQRTIPDISPTGIGLRLTDKSIRVKASTGGSFYMHFSMSQPISKLQEQLCDHYAKIDPVGTDPRATNPNVHTIVYQGKKLDPNKTLSDYNVDPEIGILVHSMPPSQPNGVEAVETDPSSNNKISILLKTMIGENFSVKVNPSDTVRELQNQICQYYQKQKKDSDVIDFRCTDPNYHRLIFQGKALEAGRTLSDYGINGNSGLIQLVHRHG